MELEEWREALQRPRELPTPPVQAATSTGPQGPIKRPVLMVHNGLTPVSSPPQSQSMAVCWALSQ